MNRFSIILMFTALIVGAGCNLPERSRMTSMLDNIETYINDRPADALSALRSMDMDSLRGASQRARAALLHQIALDKCYIDITSDSILSPAYWYLKHGTANQRLKTWYYRSVLARNAGDAEEEMACLIRGEQYITRAQDPLIAGFVYTAKRVLLLNSYDLEGAMIEAEKAVNSFSITDAQIRYHNAQIGLANIYKLLGKSEAYYDIIDSLLKEWGLLTDKQRGLVGAINLEFMASEQDADNLIPAITGYISSVPSEFVEWLSVANAWLTAGQVDSAGQALQKYALSLEDPSQDMQYYLVLSQVLKAQGDAGGSLEAYRNYNNLSDKKLQDSITSGIRSVPERENSQRRLRRLSNQIMLLMLSLVMLVLILWIGAKRVRNRVGLEAEETRRWMGEYNRVCEEIARLDKIQKQGLQQLDSPLLTERLGTLNQYTVNYMQGNKQECERLAQKLFSFDSIYPTFVLSHPGFISFLQARGLNRRELECCVFIVLGLDRKEIAYYVDLDQQYVYNVFSRIRKKLGVSSKAKMSIREYLEQELTLLDASESNIS